MNAISHARPRAGKPGGTDPEHAGAPPAVHLSLRRRQRVPLLQEGPDYLYVLESGCLTLDAVLSGERRQVMSILYPGDVVARSATPPAPHIGLTAMGPASLNRYLADDMTGDVDATGASIRQAIGRVAARSQLHTVAIGRLTGEERIATLFLELGYNLGKTLPTGLSFEIPLTRSDMADYMALNPDTLSRLVSRLRSSGVLAMPARSRATIKDVAAMEAMTPLAAALRQMCAFQSPSLVPA